MSIRSRIATFEARNQELRKTIPSIRGKGGEADEELMTTTGVSNLMEEEEPRIVSPSSVAGRFGSTSLASQQQQKQKQQQKQQQHSLRRSGGVPNSSEALEDDILDEPPRVQRYQPLHQQYHQRQQHQRQKQQQKLLHQKQQQQQQQQQQQRPKKPQPEQAPRLLRPPDGAEGEPSPTRRSSPHRRAAHHQRRLEQTRRSEDNQRRLLQEQAQTEKAQQQQQGYLPNRGSHYHNEQTSPPHSASLSRVQATEQVTSKFAKTSTAQRLAKIQRMQRNRSLEKVRRNHQATRLEESYDEQPSPDAVPRDLSLQASAADDEITLTSVRQIVGTTTSLSTSPTSAGNNNNNKQKQQPSAHLYPNEMTYTADRDWPEEKSDKVMSSGGGGGGAPNIMRMSASSSSEEGGRRRQRVGSSSGGGASRQAVPGIASQLTPDVASFFEESQRRFLHPNSPSPGDDDDDDDDDDDGAASQGSESFAKRKERERLEQVAREAAVEKAKAEMEGPFLKPEDVDYYQKSIDTPMVKTAAGVAVAATIGCVVLGPVGLLVGAAAVGIGVGVMQIPVEQRQNLEEKASRTLRQVSDTALSASESLSTACANSYQDSGLADHVPDEVNNCCAAIQQVPTMDKSEMSGVSGHHFGDNQGGGGAGGGGGGGKTHSHDPADCHEDADRTTEEAPPPTRLPPRRAGAACLRDGTFTPVSLIYTLNPTDQPRAWLDVLASAETSHDEKMEALEEIMILAKDKSRARILVEEGILDSIMWTLGRYFEKLYGPEDAQQTWAHPEITTEETRMAKLSANCCLQLGKAYCAAMHTDGDLMLMSLYERGTVPEERQLAQMLHEVPYHTRVTKTRDPTVVDPAGEVFAVVQMSLPQAEEFAKSVKALAHGQSYSM